MRVIKGAKMPIYYVSESKKRLRSFFSLQVLPPVLEVLVRQNPLKRP